jgi:molecular chaperone GrpE
MNDKDETQMNDEDLSSERDVSLGGGVDVLPQEELDDIEIETYNDDIIGSGTMTPQDRIRRLREQLKECQREKQEYLDGWQRLKADFINFKRREEEAKQEFIKYSREGIVTDLLPVLESFRMAFANKEVWEKVDPSWRVGVEHIHTQLTQALSANGLEEIDPKEQDFDPNEHTAIEAIPTSDETLYGKIAEVVHVGYRLNGKVIRSPQVKVYKEHGE